MVWYDRVWKVGKYLIFKINMSLSYKFNSVCIDILKLNFNILLYDNSMIIICSTSTNIYSNNRVLGHPKKIVIV